MILTVFLGNIIVFTDGTKICTMYNILKLFRTDHGKMLDL